MVHVGPIFQHWRALIRLIVIICGCCGPCGLLVLMGLVHVAFDHGNGLRGMLLKLLEGQASEFG